MRFLHTADWQIGMRLRHAGNGASRVRAQRIETARSLATVAREHAVDAVLLAGDVFEDNGVDRTDVQRVADALTAFDLPVYILPGNHDPLVTGSVWDHPAWQRSTNLHVLRSAAPLEIRPGITLFPCPAFAKMSTADPTRWIGAAGGDGTRIGIAHGTVAGAAVNEDCYPIARTAATDTGLAYLALGHWHSTSSFDEELGSARMAYCGTHETTKFGERDSGNVLIVDVGGPAARPSIERVPTGQFSWRIIARELRDRIDLEAVIAEVDAIADPDRTLLEIRLAGVVRNTDIRELSRLRDLVGARFPLLGRIDDDGLVPAPVGDDWAEALSPGVLRDVARKLRCEGDDRGRRALMLLYGFCQMEGELRA